MTEPIYIPCEGEGETNFGYCRMCAEVFEDSIIPHHNRLDILAMINRGDFNNPQAESRKQT